MTPSTKATLLRAVGIGLGFSLGLCLVAVIFAWWSSRPKAIAPWNPKAITATYVNFRVNEDSLYAFSYSLRNNTESDYEIGSDTPLHITGKTVEGDLAECDNCISLERPIFIPAHKSTQVTVLFHYRSPGGTDSADGTQSKVEQDEAHKKALANLIGAYSRFDGFEIFDARDRYEITMAPGWKK